MKVPLARPEDAAPSIRRRSAAVYGTRSVAFCGGGVMAMVVNHATTTTKNPQKPGRLFAGARRAVEGRCCGGVSPSPSATKKLLLVLGQIRSRCGKPRTSIFFARLPVGFAPAKSARGSVSLI